MTSVPLSVGTLAAPEILRAPHAERARFIDSIVAHGLDHVFIADHVSFHVGTGMDGLINAATLTALNPSLNVVVGVYLLALRHPVTVARQLATIAESRRDNWCSESALAAKTATKSRCAASIRAPAGAGPTSRFTYCDSCSMGTR